MSGSNETNVCYKLITFQSKGLGKRGWCKLTDNRMKKANRTHECFQQYFPFDTEKCLTGFWCVTTPGVSLLQLYELLPWLMCRRPGPHKKVLSCYDVLSSFSRMEVRRHVERGTPDEPQDFIDFYLAEIEKVSVRSAWLHTDAVCKAKQTTKSSILKPYCSLLYFIGLFTQTML